MAVAFQAYTAEGSIAGAVVADGRLADLLASFGSIVVEGGVFQPLNGEERTTEPWSTVEVDDLLVVVTPPETVTPSHASWHALEVETGPYRVRGELPALPGFDPARALARPSGAFVLLASVTVSRAGADNAIALARHPFVWVNRYAVEAVRSDLELGFFFPGAREATAHAGSADA